MHLYSFGEINLVSDRITKMGRAVKTRSIEMNTKDMIVEIRPWSEIFDANHNDFQAKYLHGNAIHNISDDENTLTVKLTKNVTVNEFNKWKTWVLDQGRTFVIRE